MSDLRNKFIDELAAELEKAELPNAETILTDYISDYDSKINKGMTDMEAIISLGDPQDIVNSLITDNANISKEELLKATLEDTVADLLNKELPTDKKKGKKDSDKKSKSKKDAKPDKEQKVASVEKPEQPKEIKVVAVDKLKEEKEVEKLKKQLKREEEHKAKEEKKKKKQKKKKPKKKKKRILLKFCIFLSIIITATIIPVAVIFAGLNFLLDGDIMNKLIVSGISLGLAIVSFLLNKFFRNIVKRMVIKNQK